MLFDLFDENGCEIFGKLQEDQHSNTFHLQSHSTEEPPFRRSFDVSFVTTSSNYVTIKNQSNKHLSNQIDSEYAGIKINCKTYFQIQNKTKIWLTQNSIEKTKSNTAYIDQNQVIINQNIDYTNKRTKNQHMDNLIKNDKIMSYTDTCLPHTPTFIPRGKTLSPKNTNIKHGIPQNSFYL